MKTFLRNLGAALLGYVAVSIVSFVLPVAMWMVLGPEGSFRPESWDTSTAWNVGWIIVAVTGAATGGFVCSKVAADRRGVWILIAVLLVAGRWRWPSTFRRARECVPRMSACSRPWLRRGVLRGWAG